MGKLARFGVSLDEKLLAKYDEHIEGKGYTNRSEALRDLIRDSLVAEEWSAGEDMAVAVVTLIYDHHQIELPRRLTRAQHDHHDLVVSSLHVHLDHDNCLEVLVLRGKARDVKSMADKLVSVRGVKLGKISATSTPGGLH